MSFELTAQERTVLEATFKGAASSNDAERNTNAMVIAQNIQAPLREVVLSGDTIGGVFTPWDFQNNPHVQFPVDMLTPGQEREFYAYVIPDHGRIPERRVEADYFMVPTYRIGNAIDCTLKFLRDANWPVISRMMEIMEAGFTKKMCDDGWQTVIGAATDRNVIVNDPNAVQGQFTPRLITLLSTYMRRNGGGNSASPNRSKLTDLYMSPEAHMDIRSWGLDLIPDEVRKNIFYAPDGNSDLINIYGVKLHAMDEFGVGQEYQTYFTSTLGGDLTSVSDLEILVGLDLTRSDTFAMPVRENVQVFNDSVQMHRRGLAGWYGWAELGFSVTDNRKSILASV